MGAPASQSASPDLTPFALCSAPRFRHRVHASRHDSSPPCRLQLLHVSSAVLVAALLRDHLTAQPPAAFGRYRFGFRQNKLRLHGKMGNRWGGAEPNKFYGVVVAVVGWGKHGSES